MSKRRKGTAAVAVRDDVAAEVEAAYRRHWKVRIRHRPPAEREAWLKQGDVQRALGVTVCRKRLEEMELRRRANAILAAGAAMSAERESTGAELPIFYDDAGRQVPAVRWQVRDGRWPGERNMPDEVATTVLPATCPIGRRNGVRMVLSKCVARNGCDGADAEGLPVAGQPTRRWTPPQAVGEEDLVDGQGFLEAAFYPHPESVSAAVIIRIGHMRGKPVGGNW